MSRACDHLKDCYAKSLNSQSDELKVKYEELVLANRILEEGNRSERSQIQKNAAVNDMLESFQKPFSLEGLMDDSDQQVSEREELLEIADMLDRKITRILEEDLSLEELLALNADPEYNPSPAKKAKLMV